MTRLTRATIGLVAIALFLIGWLLASESDYAQEMRECEHYWNQVKIYLDTDGKYGWPPFPSVCQPEVKPIPLR